MDHVTYPDDRPEWADSPPDLESEVHTWPVTTGGCDEIEKCEEKLDALLRASVALYIKDSTGWTCDEAFLDAKWIEEELIGRRYVGAFTKGDSELNEIAVELQFDADAREKISRAEKNAREEFLRAEKNEQLKARLRASSGLFAIAVMRSVLHGRFARPDQSALRLKRGIFGSNRIDRGKTIPVENSVDTFASPTM